MGKNPKQLSKIIGKKIRIITSPEGISDAERFVKQIVEPVELRILR